MPRKNIHDVQAGHDSISQSNLLRLPRELRDLIYLHLVDETTAAPKDPDHGGERDASWKTPCTIHIQARSPKPALLQLKLCNKQIYAEVHSTLARHVVHGSGPAHLDIMMKGSSIWPTWLTLPKTSHLEPTIDITLRIFEAKGWGPEFCTGAYRGLWSLLNLLIFQGPCLTHNRVGRLPTPWSVDRLRFEIKLCFPTSVDDLSVTYRTVFDRLEKLAWDNVGLGNVGMIEAYMGRDWRVWRLKQLPTGLTLASRVV